MKRIMDPFITQIIEGCSRLAEGKKPQYLILAGSFGSHTYLQKRMRETLEFLNVESITVEESW
jgi:hypothetical protein